MKTIIIEDEKKNRIQLKNLLLKHCPQLQLIGEAVNAAQGISLIRSLEPELIFLDIQMPERSGFDMLADLGEYNFEVVFVTGFDQYGIEAIRFSALDYLLKPVNPEELIRAVSKAELKNKKKQTQEQILNLFSVLKNPKKSGNRIALPLMKEIRFVDPEDIIRCEAANNYTQFYLQNAEKLLVSKGMFEYEGMLRDYHFIRCHQSHLVNKRYIKSLLKKDTIPELLLTDGSLIPVSRLKMNAVRSELMN